MRKKAWILAILLFVAGATGWLWVAGWEPIQNTLAFVNLKVQGGETRTSLPAPMRRPWNRIHSWVYWLNGPRLDEIGRSRFELAVIDYSADGTGAREFRPEEIEALRHAGCERRVLSYLSIGEAEDYRFYWQLPWRPGAPDWIVNANPDWPRNYPVRYWEPAWQGLIYQYLDRILAQGFDGVYLDRIDVYGESYASGHEQDMVDFVHAIARYARKRSPLGEDFAVVVQNAEELAGKYPDYVAEVTGIAREEVYVRATNRPTSSVERARAEAYLDSFRQRSRGNLVLSVDYTDRPELVREAYERAGARGYVPYVADVELDRIRIYRGFEPVCPSAR